jgi:hypothetical protein
MSLTVGELKEFLDDRPDNANVMIQTFSGGAYGYQHVVDISMKSFKGPSMLGGNSMKSVCLDRIEISDSLKP